ncbi:hypothetical protein [Mucilaginibacter sp.]|uniref:hypothetical protein n=1 Tax=Mucilaginibacter sp. TaxID=1882438 RepID=UPI00261D7F2B|nr:hypothetical protein [Mucilaginibacter sp.]MDB4927345.1 hypothetical protein [Mucilaginibacter sp.]
MKNLTPTIAIIVIVFTIAACKKKNNPANEVTPVKEPVMIYTDLSGKILKDPNTAYHIDINKDGIADVHMQAFALGAIDRYELQFKAVTSPGTYLSVDNNEQTAPFLLKDKITTADMTLHQWLEVAAIVLMNNVTPAGAPYWAGNWQNLSHVYLPIMQIKNGTYYAGWIELSTNTKTGTVELHRAAISTEPNVAVKAGV